MTGTGELSPGDELAGYRVESHVGSGGMGHVYRAIAPDGRVVALKIYKPKFAQDPTFRRRFEREVGVAQRVEHPHVASTLAHGEHDGQPWMAQVLVEGGSLLDRLKEGGPMSVEETVRVISQVAEGLDALHGAGLIHRDVKPGNIFMAADGEALVGDFGLTKYTQGSVLTAPGMTIGSIDYMPPEQVRGETVTPASDVYALGCIAFHCLTGNAPFHDRKGMQVLWAHIQDAPPPVAPDRDDVTDKLREAVLAALAKDPAERPPTAPAYAQLLRTAAAA